MKHTYYTKTLLNEGQDQALPAIKRVDSGLSLKADFRERAVKALPGIGPIGTPDEAEMVLLRRVLPDPSITADELFVWPVLMCNDLPDRHIQRFDQGTLQEFLDLPASLGPIGKSVIVGHGYEAQGGIPDGRIYHAQLVQDASNVNPQTNAASTWMVGRCYTVRTPEMEDTIQKIRSGVFSFVSVGVIVKEEVDPTTGNRWGWDYYLSEDGTRRNEKTGVSILRGAREFVELSYQITLGAQHGAGTNGAMKTADTPILEAPSMKTKSLTSKLGVTLDIPEDQFDAVKSAIEKVEAAADGRISAVQGELDAAKTAHAADLEAHKATLGTVTTERDAAVAKTAELDGKVVQLTAEVTTHKTRADEAEGQVKEVKDALLERLEQEAIAAGEDEDSAKEQVELYSGKSFDAIRKRIEKYADLKAKRITAGQQSVPADGDQTPTNETVDVERGRRVAGSLFGKRFATEEE